MLYKNNYMARQSIPEAQKLHIGKGIFCVNQISSQFLEFASATVPFPNFANHVSMEDVIMGMLHITSTRQLPYSHVNV